PSCMMPWAIRSAMFQRASAPYPSFDNPAGGASPPSKSQSFLAGSSSGVTVIFGGLEVLSTVLTAPFQVPNTAWGGIGVPPDCQSLARLFGSEVMSVINSAG